MRVPNPNFHLTSKEAEILIEACDYRIRALYNCIRTGEIQRMETETEALRARILQHQQTLNLLT